MTIYRGIYQSDLGLSLPSIRLEVYSVINGIRSATNDNFDADYLPQVYKSHVESVPPRFNLCDFPLGRVRYAKLFYNSTDYLRVDLPFTPGSNNYEQFFTDVFANSLIFFVGLEGELISDDFYLRRFVA
ncbi:hypothetical protein [Microcystis sp. M061S2]|uniref:hypothetical protein n=1 Tax=Microcystis sp. M061S2 TaxID=2771171 RepID=UPI0025857436|nr:hypothetical protein [Microcystis sp. M061S2]MCA2652894.1 hypothetical protein [Microcystis sp. M061S2]